MQIKEKDFVEIEYIGKVKDTDIIFDLTDEKLAKEKEIYQQGANYSPKVLCVGRAHLLPALEKSLINKSEGETYEVTLLPEQAFGKKDSKLIRTISTQTLLNQKINPYPGLQIQIQGIPGTIRSVSRGRTMVDFNHPLAGRTVIYTIKILSIIKDTEKQLKGIMNTLLGIKDIQLESKDKEFTIKNKIPKPIQESFVKEIKEIIPGISLKFA